MRKWTWVRVVIVILSFAIALFPSPKTASVPPLDWEALLAALLVIPIGLLFVVGIQRVNPRSAPVWRYPDWSLNPFTMKEPLQFFHFASYVFLAGGVGHVIRVAVSSNQATLDDLFGAAIGVGLLIGVKLCAVVFRNKMGPKKEPA